MLTFELSFKKHSLTPLPLTSMVKKYVDRNYKHAMPNTRLGFAIKFAATKQGGIGIFMLISVLCLAVTPSYYEYKEVGRKEFMRMEDRKVEMVKKTIEEV